MNPTAKFRAMLMAVALVAGCGSDGDKDSTGPAGSAGQRTTRGSRGDSRATQTELASVDLTALLTDVPEYQGQGRNLFDYGRPPAPPTPPPRPQPVRPAPPGPPSPQPTRPAPAFRVDLKFAGFVETEEPGGQKKKHAVFLDGQEILTGAEGDLVANRYRIVQIGLESVTVGATDSNATQRIPLRSN